MAKYSIGIDFGSLSARALVVDVQTGRELGTAISDYPHAVMDEHLPSGKRLPPDWALQHPQDYLDCMASSVKGAVAQSGIDPGDVIGIGIDFTACTMIATKADGTPLCFLEEFREEPHSYIKLWKHHAAQDHANRLNEIAGQRGEAFLARYGGKISSEWLFPKIWQVLEEAPDVYDAADRFLETADWVIWMLTGVERRNSCTAGYKGIWHKRDGYPSNDFFKALDPRLENVVDEKLSRQIYPVGTRAGGLTEDMARQLGLKPGVAVAVANVDAHVSMPAAGITGPGKLLMIMGTSTCHILLGDSERSVPGICGVVEDGVLPGFFGYEAGQSCVGDHFDWFVKSCVPEAYEREAREKGISVHQLLREKVQRQKPGESGLLALDWWNGNRSVLVDVDLTGMMLGMTLTTKPEEIYRALIEATAYGTRMIVDNFETYGVRVTDLVACGGITGKDPMMMQIYADVTGREISIARSKQAPALGSAMFGALAAGGVQGGFDSIEEAARAMGGVQEKTYRPSPEAQAIYEKLYREYVRLHDYFGRGENDVMKQLKAIRRQAAES